MKIFRNTVFAASIFIVVPALVIGTGIFFKRILAADATLAPVAVPQTVTQVSSIDSLSGVPVHIEIPAVGIANDLETGLYNSRNHTWNLSFVNAHYAGISAPANMRGGNTFIYGHNTTRIFKNLPKVQKGQQAIVKTTNGLTFYYQFESVSEIQPDNVEALNYTGKPILTVQTCSGNWDEKRQVFRFSLLRVEIPSSYTAG